MNAVRSSLGYNSWDLKSWVKYKLYDLGMHSANAETLRTWAISKELQASCSKSKKLTHAPRLEAIRITGPWQTWSNIMIASSIQCSNSIREKGTKGLDSAG